MVFLGDEYTVCEAAISDDLRLFHSGEEGAFASFSALEKALSSEGKALVFAMNAGMYHRDLSPVGLYVEDFVQKNHW